MLDKIKIIVAILTIVVVIALYYQFDQVIQLGRIGMILVGLAIATGLVLTTPTGQSAWSFIKGANVERQKVVWPTRQEAMQVTLFVIILVIIIGLMMWAFDALSFYTIYDVILKV